MEFQQNTIILQIHTHQCHPNFPIKYHQLSRYHILCGAPIYVLHPMTIGGNMLHNQYESSAQRLYSHQQARTHAHAHKYTHTHTSTHMHTHAFMHTRIYSSHFFVSDNFSRWPMSIFSYRSRWQFNFRIFPNNFAFISFSFRTK